MSLPSRELVAFRSELPTLGAAAELRNTISSTLGRLKSVPSRWIEFDAHRVSPEERALIVGELVVQGWDAEIRVQRFAPFHSYSGFPKPTFIRVRG